LILDLQARVPFIHLDPYFSVCLLTSLEVHVNAVLSQYHFALLQQLASLVHSLHLQKTLDLTDHKATLGLLQSLWPPLSLLLLFVLWMAKQFSFCQ
jgi:hypothetical protein